MKKFMVLLLVFLMLTGSFASYADDMDIINDVEIETESIEEPVEEIELLLYEDMQEEIDLVEEEDSLLELTEDTDLSPYTDYDTGDDFYEEESEFYSTQEVMSNEATSPVTQPVGNGFYLPMESIRKSDDKAGFIPGKRWSTSTNSHLACDFISARGNYNETIYPIFTGKVIEIGYNSGSGNYIRIEHDAFGIKFYSQYQHLKEKPSVSGEVFAGTTPIGVEGNTGAKVGDPGNHLHLIVWSLDTIPWTPPIENYKEIDPDLGGQPIEFNAYNRDDIYIGEYNEYIYHPFIYTKNTNGKYIKLYNPERILDGTYKPGDERKKVESITLNKNSVNLNYNKGETFQLVATVLPADAANKSVTWSTDKPEIATVTAEGLVQPIGAGNAVITCKAQDGSGANASCTVAVTKLELNAKELDMYTGQTYTLKGTIGKTKVTCSFESSNPKVVSVNKKGKITTKSVKKATKVTITATAPKKQGTATCDVTVHPKPKKLTFEQGKAKTLNVGETLDLSIDNLPKDALAIVVWSTSHKKVATVSNTGKVKAVGEGVATIEAEVLGIGATIKITVVDPKKPTGLKISSPSKTVYMGETLQLTATLSPETAESSVTWDSSNKKIAKINKKGVVTPVKAGTVTITATASKKSPKGKVVSATIKITVKESTAPTSISVGTPKKALHIGDQWQLDYKIEPSGARADLTFSSSDEAIATVNEKGIITANAEGSTTITVKTQNNKKASCKVTVIAKAGGLQLDKESLSLNVGDTYQLTCFVTEGLSGNVHFSSSNAAVAIVDANALITAVGVGEATITASMDNGATAKCTVEVTESSQTDYIDLSVFLWKNISEIREALDDPFDKLLERKSLVLNEPDFVAYEGNNGIIAYFWEKDNRVFALRINDSTPDKYTFFGLNASNSYAEVRKVVGCLNEYRRSMVFSGDINNPIVEYHNFSQPPSGKALEVDYSRKIMAFVAQDWTSEKFAGIL